jgi:hypothetical protein
VDGGRGGKYVMRIPGAGTDCSSTVPVELGNHASTAAAGVTPPVLLQLEPEMCTVVPFITGETMHPETLAGHPRTAREGGRRHQDVPREGDVQ